MIPTHSTPATSIPSPADPEKMALVVDDSRAEQRLLAALLSRLGFAVETADSGESALDWVERSARPPHLIVIDVVMPGINGFDLCRQLRDRAETATVPVIFCTSKDQEFDRFWGLRQGGSAYLVKPFSPQELIEAVRSCCPA